MSAIARHLGKDRKTVRAYLSGKREPGQRRPAGPDRFERFGSYCGIRFGDDPHLWATTLFGEVAGLGYEGSYPSFTRALRRRGLRPRCDGCAAAGTPAEFAVIAHPAGEETQWDWVELPDPPPLWGQGKNAHLLVGALCGTLALLAELAPGAGTYRQLIVSLIGQAGSLAATMLMLDQGDFAGAARYLAIAARTARQAGDDELMAITLAARGFHSAYSGDPADGLAFARDAVSVAAHGVHPRTHGWVAAVESEMHATLGDQVSFMRSIETASAQLARPMPEGQWKGIGAFSEAKITAYRGAGLMRLRHYGEAQAALLDALAQLDPMYAKHRCTAHIDLAVAFAHDGKADEAADQAGSALDIIAVTRHAENLRRVGIIYDTIKPFGTAAIRDLGSRILEARVAS